MKIYLNQKTNFLIYYLCFLILSFSTFIPLRVNAQEASFCLSPASGTYEVGEKFSVNVFIKTEGVAINAAKAKIYFSAGKLKVLNVSKLNSVFSLWPQEPVFSNSKGEISFTGGLPNPGFTGSAGKVLTILFQGKATGDAKVSFGKEIITANDPWGTNVFSSSSGGDFLIIAPKVTPPKVAPADNQPPYPFEIIVDNEGDPTNPSPLLYFETKDEISGIDYYEVKVKGKIFKVKPEETMPWRLPKLAPGSYDISVKAFDKAGNYIEEKATVKIKPIPPPKITVCPKTFKAGEELLYVSGSALPEIKVRIIFEKEGKLIEQWQTISNKEGDWSIAKGGLFKSGIYKISARAENSKGAVSNFSEPCFVKVVLAGISVGPWIVSYRMLTLLSIICLILLFLLVLYLWWRNKRTRRLIEKEALDLKKKFYKEYLELLSDIEKELWLLKVAKGKRGLSEKERKTEKELIDNLADVKNVFEKELKDIEEIK